MLLDTPRLVVAGLSGDGGKTLVALGLARAFASRGMRIAPFKKGPDYIDAAWLQAAAGAPGRNLDTFLLPPDALGTAVGRGTPADLAVIEGNRGLFDGMDAAGSHSTAELAKRLGAPVLLVMDVTKMTRTAAALVLGCSALDPEVRIGGVILNRVGTSRQEKVIRESLERVQAPPVLGAIPRLDGDPLPGRHLGLLTAAEHPQREAALQRAASAVERYLDLERVLEMAREAADTELPSREIVSSPPAVRIAVFRDEAFSFYYPENLEALEACGAELVPVSPLADPVLPEVDGIYLGGGFPEVHATELSANRGMVQAVGTASRAGMPVYAECGGLMYLARELVVEGISYPMAAAFDLVVEHYDRPQGHGYVEAQVVSSNPFYREGERIRGHEFHYSRVVAGGDRAAACLELSRGHGIGSGRDGFVTNSTWASYTHVHALGTPTWAPAFVDAARSYRENRGTTLAAWA